MSTLNDLIVSAISGAEVDEGIAAEDPTPTIEKTASFEVRVDDVEIEKIASALEWYGTTGISAIADLDKVAADMKPDLAKIRAMAAKGMSMTQAVAMAHPQMPAAERAKIVKMLSGEKVAYEKSMPSPAEEPKDNSPSMKAIAAPKAAAPKSSGSNDPDTDEGDRVSGEQASASGADATHHSSLSSNEAAMKYTKAEKSKNQSKSLQQVLDNKPFADSSLRRLLDASKGGIDPNIHATKTASDKNAILSQVKEALANKLAERVSEAN